MARDVDDVVDTTADPVEALVISSCTITRELQISRVLELETYIVSRIGFQVDIHETIVRAPDGTCDTRPRLFDTKDTFDIIAVQFFARRRIHDCRFNSEEGE